MSAGLQEFFALAVVSLVAAGILAPAFLAFAGWNARRLLKAGKVKRAMAWRKLSRGRGA